MAGFARHVKSAPCFADQIEPMRTSLATPPNTRLHALEADLATLKIDLEHQQRLATLGTLAAAISHEINNLLTPALAYAQLSQSNPDDGALAAKAIHQCITAISSATQISDAFLNLARPHEQKPTASVAQAIENALTCLGCTFSQNSINLDLQLEPDLTASISPIALQQVILNLLLNAGNALRSHKTPGRIKVEAGGYRNQIRILVTDNGHGIPKVTQGMLFEPFGVSRDTGHGLGLWICKQLIENANGSIAARSRPGCTTFTILLPAA